MSESTLDFTGNWSDGTDSFAVDSSNAVLAVDDVKQDNAIIELFNPVYDIEKKTLKRKILQDDATLIELPSQFGQATLVIDAIKVGGYQL